MEILEIILFAENYRNQTKKHNKNTKNHLLTDLQVEKF